MNLHLKLEKSVFGQGTTTPQLSSGPRRVESLEMELGSANTQPLGQNARDRVRIPGEGALHAAQQRWAGLREAPPVNVSGFLKVK